MRYFIKTYGCQMNKADSERIAAFYQLKGYKQAKSIMEADVVVINTCSVRQSAEDRVLGLINNIVKSRAKKPTLNQNKYGSGLPCTDLRSGTRAKIILTGCMLRYTLPRLRRMLPGVEEFIKIDELIENVEPLRKDKKHAWVPIMKGCDNFCSYCVVPYARGTEVSLSFEEIVCEVEELVKRGYKHITLLGQNVNSYHKSSKLKAQSSKLQRKIQNLQKKYKNNFAILLAALNEVKGLEKISFITSNPQDLTEDVIEVMKLPKIDHYLHLPVQSGDNQILRKMNRRYTAAQYLSLIKRIREKIPDIKIGTDIIVGFPGETKKQFQNTVKLCKKVVFEKAYIAKYSPRPGTAAYKLGDDVSYEEKKRRWETLDKLINKK